MASDTFDCPACNGTGTMTTESVLAWIGTFPTNPVLEVIKRRISPQDLWQTCPICKGAKKLTADQRAAFIQEVKEKPELQKVFKDVKRLLDK